MKRKPTDDKLKVKQDAYQFHEYNEDVDLPAQVAVLPKEERFSIFQRIQFLLTLIFLKVAIFLDNKILIYFRNKWESMDDINKMYGLLFPKPECERKWKDDQTFGDQRVNGLNPTLIELCKEIPKSMQETKVTTDIEDHLDGLTIQQAIDQKCLFIVDLGVLQKGISTAPKLKLCAPIGLFFCKDGVLLPVAIQLFQQPEHTHPVFTPPARKPEQSGCLSDDPDMVKWTLVKMWFNNADAVYHQSVAHLGLTHLLMEGIAVATNRQLPSEHPIYKLLKPHFLYTMAINKIAGAKLMNPGGFLDKTMTTGTKGTMDLIKEVLKHWRMDIDGTLPEDLKRRGLDDPTVLQCYYYRDDALLLYKAIKDYVTNYTDLCYSAVHKDRPITKDLPLQLWARELVRDRNNHDGGCGLKGVPGDGKLETTDQLVTILTSIIFTCSVQHAAVNFAQYEQYGFPPNYPSLLHGEPPKGEAEGYSERDMLDALPTPHEMVDIMVINKFLSFKSTNNLGLFETNYFTDTDAKNCLEKFKKAVEGIQTEIDKKDRRYKQLIKDKVPNAISI